MISTVAATPVPASCAVFRLVDEKTNAIAHRTKIRIASGNAVR
jgi:hypothetical protein